MNIEQARFNMIEQQIRPCDITDNHLLDIIKSTPREAFVNDDQRALAFADTNLSIAHHEVMMTPVQEAKMLHSLNLSKEHKVLEIGTGSGYVTALLAALTSQVCSEEIHADLSQQVAQRLKKNEITNVDLIITDSLSKRSLSDRFDRIIVTASLPVYDPMFQYQLSIGGQLFIIVGNYAIMEARLITRLSEREWHNESLFETTIPALIGAKQPNTFKL